MPCSTQPWGRGRPLSGGPVPGRCGGPVLGLASRWGQPYLPGRWPLKLPGISSKVSQGKVPAVPFPWLGLPHRLPPP